MANRKRHPTTLGNLIRQARRDRDLTQQELADVTGVGRTTIDALEGGDIDVPRPEMLNKLRRGVGLSMRQLLSAAGYDFSADDDDLDALFEGRDEVAEGLENVLRRLRGLQRPDQAEE